MRDNSLQQSQILFIGMVLLSLSLWDTVFALGQRPAVIYIRAIAVELDLTPTQVDSLTKQQAATYILQEYPSIPEAKLKEASTYWPGIKTMLMRDSVERRMQERLVLLRQQLNSAYPDAVGLQTDYAKDLARKLLPLLYGEVDPNELL